MGNENPLLQRLRLDIADQDTLEGMAENPGFISRFREWEYDPTDFTDLVQFVQWSGPFDRVWSYDELHDGDAIPQALEQSSPSELRGVYDAYVRAVEQKAKEPNGVLYHQFLNAYVNILRRWERSAKTIGFLERHVKPHFGADGYLDKRDLQWIVGNAAQANPEEYAGVDIRDMAKILGGGITRNELAAVVSSVTRRDQTRKTLHKDLLEYGRKLGYAAEGVMAEIVVGLHHTDSVALTDQRTIVVVGGVLLVGYYDPQTLQTVGERSFHKPPVEGAWNHEYWLRDREIANNILHRWLAGEWVSSPEYRSRLHGLATPEEVTGVFSRIETENPDIPITHGFELSHCAHGRVVISHRLQADISSLHNPEGLDNRLPRFLEYLRTYTAGSRERFLRNIN